MLDLCEAREPDEDALLAKAFEMNLTQRDRNKAVINEDAEYKAMAFDGIAQQRTTGLTNSEEDLTIRYNVQDSFEHFYREQLSRDARLAPRPVNAEDYVPKKPWEKTDEKYKKRPEREEEYFA